MHVAEGKLTHVLVDTCFTLYSNRTASYFMQSSRLNSRSMEHICARLGLQKPGKTAQITCGYQKILFLVSIVINNFCKLFMVNFKPAHSF